MVIWQHLRHPESFFKMNVHTEHCCKDCGCKYGDWYCPVERGTMSASGKCYSCSDWEFENMRENYHRVKTLEVSSDNNLQQYSDAELIAELDRRLKRKYDG